MDKCDLCGNMGPAMLGFQCIKCNYPTELMGLKAKVAEQAESIEKLKTIIKNQKRESDWLDQNLRQMKYERNKALDDISKHWKPALSLVQATLDKVVGNSCPYTENGHCDECIRCLQKRLADEQAAEEYAYLRAEQAIAQVESLVQLIRNTPNTPIEIVGEGRALENLSTREKPKK